MPVPTTGAIFTIERRIGLGSIDPEGVIRLDAIAGLLQDVATENDEGTADPDHGIWVLRRLSVVLAGRRLPRYGERVRLRTFCGGLGGRWAERRTSIDGPEDVGIECAAIWVRVDRTGRPTPLTEHFLHVHRATAAGRTVSARRSHSDPDANAESRPWPLRRVDLDTMGHVNNAAHWNAVEEVLDGRRYKWAEIEFRDGLLRDPANPADLRVHEQDSSLSVWLCTDDKVRSSARIALQ